MTTQPTITMAQMASLYARAFVNERAWGEDELAALSAPPHGHLITHSDQGFLIARLVFDEAELLTICTDPNARRQGIARHLLTELTALCIARDISRILLEVARNNTAARALYAAHGFEQIGERRGYYAYRDGRREDALILCKNIAANAASPHELRVDLV